MEKEFQKCKANADDKSAFACLCNHRNLLLILAFLLYKMGLGESQINIGIMVTYIVSCLFGGFYMGKKIKVRRFAWGMGVGTGYAVLLMAVTFLTVHQISGDFKEMLMMFFLCFFGGTLGGILA